jgi:DNA-binding transcriptional LysR family regulator
MVLAPKLGAFTHAYPDVTVDVTTTTEMRLDLVAGHFDTSGRRGPARWAPAEASWLGQHV